MTRSFARSATSLLLLLNAAWLGPAIAADPETEASRELEFRFQLAPATRLFVTTSLSRNNFRSSKEISLALALDRKISQAWSYRVGIRQIGTAESEDRTLESRAVVDMTYQRALGAKWTLYNRNRADLRWLESKPFSYRLRDRLMLERSASVGSRDITWYASYEIILTAGMRVLPGIGASSAFRCPSLASRQWRSTPRGQTSTVRMIVRRTPLASC